MPRISHVQKDPAPTPHPEGDRAKDRHAPPVRRHERERPGQRRDTLIHLGGDFYLGRLPDLGWVLHHGFKPSGGPRHSTYYGSLEALAICAGRYKCQELSTRARTLAELEARLQEAIRAQLAAVAT